MRDPVCLAAAGAVGVEVEAETVWLNGVADRLDLSACGGHGREIDPELPRNGGGGGARRPPGGVALDRAVQVDQGEGRSLRGGRGGGLAGKGGHSVGPRLEVALEL